MAANPYASSAFYARVGDTFGTIRPSGANVVREFIPSAKASKSATLMIRELLEFVGLPLPIRAIQAVMVFRFGFRVGQVTYALERVDANRSTVWRGTKPIYQFAKETHVLCVNQPSDAHLRLLRKMLEEARDMLTKEQIRDAGEQWVRRWLLTHGFTGVTQVNRLGKIVVPYRPGEEGDPHSLDVLATEVSSGIDYGISVKNKRAILTRGNSAIADVYTKAKAHGRRPMLFVPFVDSAAEERCLTDGIRLEVMRAQIVPAEDSSKRPMSSVINGLRAVLGPQPYVFKPKRDRHKV